MRNLDWVPGEEIRLALFEVIKAAFSVSEDEAFKEALSRLGLQRLTSTGRERFEVELATLVSDGKVQQIDGRLQAILDSASV